MLTMEETQPEYQLTRSSKKRLCSREHGLQTMKTSIVLIVIMLTMEETQPEYQ